MLCQVGDVMQTCQNAEDGPDREREVQLYFYLPGKKLRNRVRLRWGRGGFPGRVCGGMGGFIKFWIECLRRGPDISFLDNSPRTLPPPDNSPPENSPSQLG